MGFLFAKPGADPAGKTEGDDPAAPAAPAGEEKAEAAGEKPGGEDPPEKPSIFEKPKAKPNGSVDDRGFHKHPRFIELREERDEHKVGRAMAEKERDEATPYRKAVEGRYGAEGSLAALEFDISLLDAFEALEATDPIVRQAAAKVRQYAEKGVKVSPNGKAAEPARKAAPEAEAAAARPDPLLARMAERDARATILEALKPYGIKEAFQRTIANDLIRSVGAKGPAELADLTAEAVEEHARAWIAEHGFSEEELTGRKVKRSEARTTPSSNGAAAGAGGGPGNGEADGPPKGHKAPNNFREWQRDHESRVAAVQRSLGSRS